MTLFSIEDIVERIMDMDKKVLQTAMINVYQTHDYKLHIYEGLFALDVKNKGFPKGVDWTEAESEWWEHHISALCRNNGWSLEGRSGGHLIPLSQEISIDYYELSKYISDFIADNRINIILDDQYINIDNGDIDDYIELLCNEMDLEQVLYVDGLQDELDGIEKLQIQMETHEYWVDVFGYDYRVRDEVKEDKTLEELQNENVALRDKILSQLSAIEEQIKSVKEGLDE